ncbi:MAG: class I SAM-dependent methyltransferase [Myxococcales bacterium]
MTLLALSLLLMAPHPHEHQHGKHGNPEDVDSYIARMEEPGRAAWQKPDEVLKALGLAPGQVVCDIGAGPGYFALRAARLGTQVFAVDVEPRILQALQKRIAKSGLRTVTPVLGLDDDPLIPERACDLVLVVDTYHHFPDGPAYLQRLARSLKPGGRIANIDFHKRELPVGPPVQHKVTRDDFLRDAQAAGLELDKEYDFLPYQYFLVLRPR